MTARPALTAWALIAVSVLAGCASEETSGYSERSDQAPDCEEVWVTGETLPASYDGCNDRSGAFNPRIEVAPDCDLTSMIDGQTVRFAELGRQISESPLSTLLEDEAYSAALNKCSISDSPG